LILSREAAYAVFDVLKMDLQYTLFVIQLVLVKDEYIQYKNTVFHVNVDTGMSMLKRAEIYEPYVLEFLLILTLSEYFNTIGAFHIKPVHTS